jgi:hypothetical protein
MSLLAQQAAAKPPDVVVCFTDCCAITVVCGSRKGLLRYCTINSALVSITHRCLLHALLTPLSTTCTAYNNNACSGGVTYTQSACRTLAVAVLCMLPLYVLVVLAASMCFRAGCGCCSC